VEAYTSSLLFVHSAMHAEYNMRILILGKQDFTVSNTAIVIFSLRSSNRWHLSYDVGLEVKREDNQNCSVCVVYDSCAQ